MANMPKPAFMTLAKENRIRKRRDYLRIQRNGTRAFGRFLVAVAERNHDRSRGRIGLTVPKKVGMAHVRNKVKRRLRHLLRLNQELFFEKNIVIVARDCAKEASFSELQGDLIDICQRLKLKNHQGLQFRNSAKVA